MYIYIYIFIYNIYIYLKILCKYKYIHTHSSRICMFKVLTLAAVPFHFPSARHPPTHVQRRFVLDG